MLKVTSPAVAPGERIPTKYTGEGENISPPLHWESVPDGTREFVLVCEDPDAPSDEPWVHWIVYGIPKERTSLPEANNGGGLAGANSWGDSVYGGPMPPPGDGPHHYQFRVFAIDEPVSLPPGATKEQALEAIEGHILAEGELIGTYER
jgi:Raf kinase inhibitor-like YbhB/YbcL family protein